MFKTAKPLFLIVETPLHAGSGTELGVVDLPIQREKHTDYPKIEGSGLKGSIREIFETQPNKEQIELGWNISVESDKYRQAIQLTFGPEQGDLHAGALGFTDARLLLFPVKSVSGIFAWITCPAVLSRFKIDLELCGISFLDEIPNPNQIPNESNLIVSDNKIVLEEYTFDVAQDSAVNALANWMATNVLPSDSTYDYWRDKITKDLVVLNDNDFRDFVTLSTEVIARIKMDPNTGTVDKKIGGLWYEEYLPSDSIMYSLALTTPIFQEDESEKGIFALKQEEIDEGREESEKVMEFFEDGLPAVIQIGGNATIGKGIVRTKIYEVAAP